MIENIHNATSSLISQIDSDELFKKIVENARDISDAKFVILSSYDDEREIMKPKAVSGANNSLIKQVSDIFNVDSLLDIEFPVNGTPRFENFSKQKGKEILTLEGFREYTFGLLNEQKSKMVEEVTGVEEIIVAPLLNSKEKLIGVLAYLFENENKERNKEILTIFADLAAQAIEKSRMLDAKLEKEAEEMKRENVNMTAEVMTGSIVRRFGVNVSAREMGLKKILEHMAELAIEPSRPSVIFDFMAKGVQNSLSKEGVEIDSEEIKEVIAPHLKKFLMEIFSVTSNLDKEIPTVYVEFEEQLSAK